MPDLATIGTFIANNPYIIPTATSAISGAFRAINPDRQQELKDQVLNSQLMFRNTIARRAMGNFAPADREQIMQNAEPQVNQIASGLARRGLGGSGAGAQVIAQAQQQPFFTAQQQALQALPAFDAQITQATQALMGDGSFMNDLQAIASLLYEEFSKDPDNPETQAQVTQLWQLLGSPTPKAAIGTDERTYQGFQQHLSR